MSNTKELEELKQIALGILMTMHPGTRSVHLAESYWIHHPGSSPEITFEASIHPHPNGVEACWVSGNKATIDEIVSSAEESANEKPDGAVISIPTPGPQDIHDTETPEENGVFF